MSTPLMSGRFDIKHNVTLGDARSKQMQAGVYALALGSIATGIFDFIWADFEAGHQPIQALGDHIPGRQILAYIAATWLVAGGAAILMQRMARAGAIALAAIYLIFGLFCLPRYYTAPHILGFHIPVLIGVSVGFAQQLIVVAAALLVHAAMTTRHSVWRRRVPPIARWTFGVSSIIFGLAHATAVQVVAPMVPKWIPLGGSFWAIVTGIAFVTAGVSILSGILDMLAARLLALMLLVFSLLVLIPGPFAHPHNHVAWGSNAYNLAAIGAALVYAASIAARRVEVQTSARADVALRAGAIRLSGYTRSVATLVSLEAKSVPFDPADLDRKEHALFECLRNLKRVIVAYSGGTDSAYLAWAAHHVLGSDAIAITADSASIPRSHKRDAEEFARQCGFHHEYIDTFEFENPDYVKNDKDRCFHCKDELFVRLEAFAAERGYTNIVYGVNKDDLGDYRPGQRAAKLHEVKAPLVEAQLSKAEIRELSKRAGLSTWDRPAAACLSSRVPYGTPVTAQTIRTIEEGEEAIKALGFRQFRVRFHGELVRLEIAKDELPRALTSEMASAFTNIFKPLGFLYVTLDLEGYRQGALNAALAAKA